MRLTKEVAITEYAWRHGDEAARNKLTELRWRGRQENTEPPPAGANPHISMPAEIENCKKESGPVEYKGNFLGGKKSVNDTLYNRTRESRSLQNPTTMLFYLIQHSALDGKVDKHRTYRYWYEEKKLIVATRSQEQMARDLGVSIRTIQRWLDELEEDRAAGGEAASSPPRANGDQRGFSEKSSRALILARGVENKKLDLASRHVRLFQFLCG